MPRLEKKKAVEEAGPAPEEPVETPPVDAKEEPAVAPPKKTPAPNGKRAAKPSDPVDRVPPDDTPDGTVEPPGDPVAPDEEVPDIDPPRETRKPTGVKRKIPYKKVVYYKRRRSRHVGSQLGGVRDEPVDGGRLKRKRDPDDERRTEPRSEPSSGTESESTSSSEGSSSESSDESGYEDVYSGKRGGAKGEARGKRRASGAGDRKPVRVRFVQHKDNSRPSLASLYTFI